MESLTAYWNFLFVHPLMSVLVWGYGLFNDFGLAVVLVTVVVALGLYPIYRSRNNNAARGSLPLFVQSSLVFAVYTVFVQYRLYKARSNDRAAILVPIFVQVPLVVAAYNALYAALIQVPHLDGEQMRQVLFPFVPVPAGPHQVLDLTAHWLPWLGHCPAAVVGAACGLGAPDPWHVLPIVAGLTQFIAWTMDHRMNQPAVRGAQAKLAIVATYSLLVLFLAWSLPVGARSLFGLDRPRPDSPAILHDWLGRAATRRTVGRADSHARGTFRDVTGLHIRDALP